ncbi:MAG TPA: LysM peptidoglycan-binding domain-containing protein, partial [Acidimicrobiia bacterium]|nr:LysM peptidoglycan-binding domain-containing protein [Acidimicrobiia bacterium]
MLALIRRPTTRNRRAVVVLAALLTIGSIPSMASSADATPLIATARNGPRYHVVQFGETLWQIAVRYGTTVGALVRANGIADPSLIYPGTRLVVPGSGGGSGGGSGRNSGGNPASGGWKTHVVAAGDLLWEIAIRYDTTTAVLVRANNIPNPDALRIGMRLRVPDNGSGGGGGGGGRGGGNGGGSAGWQIHVVRRGELLWEIALRYGTTAGALIRANDIPNPDALRIGMRLRVPGGGSGDNDDGGGGGGGGGSGSGNAR